MTSFVNFINADNLINLLILFWLLWALAQIFFLLYHLLRFGIGTTPKLVAITCFFGSIIVFSLVLLANWQMDWPSLINRIKTVDVQSFL